MDDRQAMLRMAALVIVVAEKGTDEEVEYTRTRFGGMLSLAAKYHDEATQLGRNIQAGLGEARRSQQETGP